MAAEPITRPNGQLYHPRKVVTVAWEDDDGGDCGCIVLGTHDIARAQPLADEACELWHGMPATRPELGWYRLGYQSSQELHWINDPVRGRAGVYFTADDPAATTPRSTT